MDQYNAMNEAALGALARPTLAAYAMALREALAAQQQQQQAGQANNADALAAALMRAAVAKESLASHPTFEAGGQSVPEFLSNSARCLADAETPLAEWVKTSSRYLRGEAHKWSTQAIEARTLVVNVLAPAGHGDVIPARTTWAEYTVMLGAWFTPIGEQQRLKEDLGRVKMGPDGLEGYVATVKQLTRFIEGMHEQEKVDKFIAGLAPKLKQAVGAMRLAAPLGGHFADVDHVAELTRGLARLQEEPAQSGGAMKKATLHALDAALGGGRRRQPFDLEATAKRTKVPADLLKKRMAAGQCFKCGADGWVRGHVCG